MQWSSVSWTGTLEVSMLTSNQHIQLIYDHQYINVLSIWSHPCGFGCISWTIPLVWVSCALYHFWVYHFPVFFLPMWSCNSFSIALMNSAQFDCWSTSSGCIVPGLVLISMVALDVFSNFISWACSRTNPTGDKLQFTDRSGYNKWWIVSFVVAVYGEKVCIYNATERHALMRWCGS